MEMTKPTRSRILHIPEIPRGYVNYLSERIKFRVYRNSQSIGMNSHELYYCWAKELVRSQKRGCSDILAERFGRAGIIHSWPPLVVQILVQVVRKYKWFRLDHSCFIQI